MKSVKKIFKKRKLEISKKIFASFMMPIFVFQMASFNLLLTGPAYAETTTDATINSDLPVDPSEIEVEKNSSLEASAVEVPDMENSSVENIESEKVNSPEEKDKTAPSKEEVVPEEEVLPGKEVDSKENTTPKEELSPENEIDSEENVTSKEEMVAMEKEATVEEVVSDVEEVQVASEAVSAIDSEFQASAEEGAPKKETKKEIWSIDGDKAVTNNPVELNKKYVAPQNDQVTVTFTKLPDEPGILSIEEITLTDEQVIQLGALSNKAYDITSDMEDGTFKYDLSLPKSGESDEIQVKYAEEKSDFNKAKTVSNNDVKIESDKVGVNLDHFTIFVVIGTIDGNKVTSFDESSAKVVINEFVYNPSSSGNEWVELYNKTDNDIDLNGWEVCELNGESGLENCYSMSINSIAGKGFVVYNFSSDKLNNNGDTIRIKDDNREIIDEVTYKKGGSNTIVGADELEEPDGTQSVARKEDGGNEWIIDNPTKGTTNGDLDDNNAPVASDQSVSVDENNSKSITLLATDADSDSLVYSIVDSPSFGSLSGTLPNVVYTPNADYYGSDSFTFKANDGKDDSNVATVSISIIKNPGSLSYPSVPVLTWPINGVIINDNTPLMQWDDSIKGSYDIAGYYYRIYYNCSDLNDIPGSCSSLYPNKTGLWRTLSEYQAGVTNNGTYYWQVRAKDVNDNYSGWSDLEKLTIDTQAPGKPTIIKPSAEQYFTSSPIRNEWTSVTDDNSGIKEYRIEYIYDDGHTFSGAPYRKTTNNWRNHIPNINEQGGVTIRVQAIDNAGNEGKWSDPVHYFYDETAPAVPTGLKRIAPNENGKALDHQKL